MQPARRRAKRRQPTPRQYNALAVALNNDSSELLYITPDDLKEKRYITTLVKRIERNAEKLGRLHRGGDAHKQIDWIGGKS